MLNIEQQELSRLDLQLHLDSKKTQVERNRLGQFATPTNLAIDILKYAKALIPNNIPLKFLDPAIGTGSFYSAFIRIFGEKASQSMGFEIDEHYGQPAQELWKKEGIEILLQDFTKAKPPVEETKKATIVICNPPYVRHHHISIEEKKRLHQLVYKRYGIPLSGLSGLYCYFLCLSKEWMSSGCIGGWLIPSEFMDVNYGKELKNFLINKVTLLHVHRFSPDDAQFDDALVSSAIVWFKNTPPPLDYNIKFTFGGSLLNPKTTKEYSSVILKEEKKWSHLSAISNCKLHNENNKNEKYIFNDFFDVKRGIATGANEFFILSSEEIQKKKISYEYLVPIIPSPRYLKKDVIECYEDGTPVMENCEFLLYTQDPEELIKQNCLNTWRYLQDGRQQGISERYLCRNRKLWYSQERREAPPFLCTYMGRTNKDSKPFRFILNHSKALAANVYLMIYPKSWLNQILKKHPEFLKELWLILKSIPMESLIGEGRIYGGGLHKIEPKELLNTPINNSFSFLVKPSNPTMQQMQLF